MKFQLLVASAVLTIWAGAAAALTIEGVSPMQVLQVDDSGKAALALSGEASGASAEVLIDLAGESSLVESWQPLGNVSEGKYVGEISLDAGGPYRVAVRTVDEAGVVLEEASVSGVLAGDLWVLAGQSNMQGVGNLDENIAKPHPQVNLLRMNHEWTMAREPINVLPESPDAVHGTYATEADRIKAIKDSYRGSKGAGLGLGFARAMVEATGRPVGLIAVAHGGTSMEQWNPNKKGDGGNSLYGSMLAQVAAAGGKVRGVLWYQGESDANPNDAPTYGDRFKTLISEMRADFGGPDMPFYYVQIGRFAFPAVDHNSWNKLRAQQLRVENEIAPGGMVAAIDLALDDLIHVGTRGLITLGERLAKLAQRDLFDQKILAGPRLRAVESFRTPYGGGIRVRLDSVNGTLSADGLLNGFVITESEDGPPVDYIYKQEVDPKNDDAILLWVMQLPATAYLSYGHGGNPYANVVDSEGLALPCFGPVPVPADVVEVFVKK